MRILLLAVCVWWCQADTELRNCPSPTLRGGFLVPQQESYDHGVKVLYSCELTLKPVVETWWGEILCGDGAWSHTPHCVDLTDCIAPVVPHATLEPPQVSYSTNSRVSFRCDKGYRLNGTDFREAVCENGKWSRLPSCVRKVNVCDPPSHVPNAIITQPYQDTFENGDTIQYLCKEGYVGHHTSRCDESEWKPPLKCGKVNVCDPPSHVPNAIITQPYQDTFENGDTIQYLCKEGYVGHHTSRCDESEWKPPIKCVHMPHQTFPKPAGGSETLPVASCKPYPTIKNGDVTEIKDGWAVKVECALYYTRVGPEVVKCVDGQWSEVPECVGLERPPSRVTACGYNPTIKNGNVTVAEDYMSLKVKCWNRYTRMGPEFVLCVNNEWTPLPTCKAPCKVDQSRFSFTQDDYFLHGFEKWFFCRGSAYTGTVKCDDGRMYYKGCGYSDW